MPTPAVTSEEAQQPNSAWVGAAALRHWRTAAAAALVCAMVATHWPRLELGVREQPIDKFLHAATYGVLTMLLAHTRWFRSLWMPMLLLALLGVLDEFTQAIPGLGRTCDLDDWVADVLGITMAASIMWAGRPVPGQLAGVLDARRALLGRMLLDRPVNWIHICTGALLGAGVVGVLCVALDSRFRAPRPLHAAVCGAIFGAAAGAALMRESGLRALERRVAGSAPCVRCGLPRAGDGAAQPAVQPAPCVRCGLVPHALAWTPFTLVNGRRAMNVCARYVAEGLAVIIGVVAAGVILTTWLRLDVPFIMRLDQMYRTLPLDMQRLLEIALVVLVGAWTFRRCRVRLARELDRSGQTCLACGYDLHAAAPNVQSGVCTECGEPFVRAQPR